MGEMAEKFCLELAALFSSRLESMSSVKNGRPTVRGKGKIYGKKLIFCTFNQIFLGKLKEIKST
jgi:hypothetical protein